MDLHTKVILKVVQWYVDPTATLRGETVLLNCTAYIYGVATEVSHVVKELIVSYDDECGIIALEIWGVDGYRSTESPNVVLEHVIQYHYLLLVARYVDQAQPLKGVEEGIHIILIRKA